MHSCHSWHVGFMSWQLRSSLAWKSIGISWAQYGHPNVSGASSLSRTRWFHFHLTLNYRPRSLDAERPKLQSHLIPDHLWRWVAPVILPFLCVVRMGSVVFAILRQDSCLGSGTDWSHEVSTWSQNYRSWRTRNIQKHKKPNHFTLKVWQTLQNMCHVLPSFDPERGIGADLGNGSDW